MAMNMEAQYARALQIGKTPQGFALLKQAALGQNDDFDQIVANMALKQLTKTKTALEGQQAQQQLANKQTVAQKNVQAADQALPEMSGIGQLPAPNMEALAAAQGGVVGYADGGYVEHYADQGLVVPEGYELFEDPITGEKYPRKIGAGMGPALGRGYDAAAGFLDRATTPGYKKTPEWYAQNMPAPAAPAAAPPAPAADNRIKAPEGVKKALAQVSQPKAPVENPTKEQKENVDDQLGYIDKLTSFLDKKFKGQLDPIRAQLDKDRDEYKNMKSENVGLALLGAAGSLLKPGRSTASAIGEGLGTLAEYGAKFQPQLLAARQGISSGEVGLAQAEAQAARGNFATAAQLANQREQAGLEREKLAMQRPYYAAYANMLNAKGAGLGAGGNDLATIKAYQASLQKQIDKAGMPTSPAEKAQLAEWQASLAQVNKLLEGRIKGLNIGDNAAPPPGSIAGSYQRP